MRRMITILAALCLITALSPSPATAAALLAPERLRVTNVTATQVSFAWSQNVSGAVMPIRGRIFQNGTQVATTPLIRYTASGLVPGATYTFHVVTADSVGNTSPPSRTLTVTTRGPGVIPPGPANLSAAENAPARVRLVFDQPDDSWDVDRYEVFDGASRIASIPGFAWVGSPTVTLDVRELAPQSSHSYSARAVRPAIGVSPTSNTLTLTTPPRTDLVAPSAPTEVRARQSVYACFSPNVTWAQSSDNTDPQPAIDYEVFVNGVREGWARGAGTFSIAVVPVGDNVIGVRAVDSSGNASATATTTFRRDPDCLEER
ncbi:fibronectin type III domain-containing protein [Nonomuraea sp. NPDC050404]|uniref:fibronectin type III domain-containing protein n=1 Tax=Nonomuraea sp. NPDC050404 TaxID=3155783 RepID=UPI0033DFCB97